MNERLVAWVNRLRRRIDQVVIFALVVLLGWVVLFYWIEQQVPEPQRPQPPLPPVSPTPVFWSEFKKRFTHPKDIERIPDLAALLDFNPFDPRILDRSELIRRLDRIYQRALEAFDKGDLDSAEQMCRRIIKQMQSHAKAIELLKRIRERRREQEKPTPSP